MSRRALVAVLRRSRIKGPEHDGTERRICFLCYMVLFSEGSIDTKSFNLKTATCKQDVSV